jgi:hypothetical protein
VVAYEVAEAKARDREMFRKMCAQGGAAAGGVL